MEAQIKTSFLYEETPDQLQAIEDIKQDLQKALGELETLRKIQESLNRLENKLDLDKLPYARGAMFNSYDQDHNSCHPATRIDVLRQIHDWAQQPHSKSIFWLSGMAGIGKARAVQTP